MSSYDLSISNKLVRDKIPEMRRRDGWDVVEQVPDVDELPKIFESKLREEFFEFKNAKTRTERFEEIADLLAVIDQIKFRKLNVDQALLRVCEHMVSNWTFIFGEKINEIRVAKAVAKGEFEGLHYIVSETRAVTT